MLFLVFYWGCLLSPIIFKKFYKRNGKRIG